MSKLYDQLRQAAEAVRSPVAGRDAVQGEAQVLAAEREAQERAVEGGAQRREGRKRRLGPRAGFAAAIAVAVAGGALLGVYASWHAATPVSPIATDTGGGAPLVLRLDRDRQSFGARLRAAAH